MPSGTMVVGHVHKTEHFNIVLTGRAVVYCEGMTSKVEAPCMFKSGAGAQKVLYIQEDMRWMTVHPTQETDVERLEDMLVDKSVTCLQNESPELLGGNAK